MDERITQIFRKYARRILAMASCVSDLRYKSVYSWMSYYKQELTELYSEVCDVSYETAVSALQEWRDDNEGDDDDEG